MGTEVYPPITILNTSAQPAAATIIAVNKLRRTATITNVAGSGVTFFIKKGASASSTNWDFQLQDGDAAVFDDYVGIVTCSPAPTAGQINVSESSTATA